MCVDVHPCMPAHMFGTGGNCACGRVMGVYRCSSRTLLCSSSSNLFLSASASSSSLRLIGSVNVFFFF